MATILAHITINAGHEQAFEDLARAMYDATHGREDDVRQYQYWRGAEPRTYYTLIAYDDHRGFVAHQASDHHEGMSAGLRDAIQHIRLEWVDPVAGASPLPPTDQQSAPDDADDLVTRYTELYAAAVADWWLPLR